jgi:hypothetical protein
MSAQGDVARAAAQMLADHARRRYIDPITEVTVRAEAVWIQVCPTAPNVWMTWCNLFRVDQSKVKRERSVVVAHGRWQGAEVVMTGLDAERWYTQ